MNKVFTEIEVPAAQKVFEVFLPQHLTGFEVLPLLRKMAEGISDSSVIIGNEPLLCKKDDGSVYDLTLPIWKLGIKNGDILVLT